MVPKLSACHPRAIRTAIRTAVRKCESPVGGRHSGSATCTTPEYPHLAFGKPPPRIRTPLQREQPSRSRQMAIGFPAGFEGRGQAWDPGEVGQHGEDYLDGRVGRAAHRVRATGLTDNWLRRSTPVRTRPAPPRTRGSGGPSSPGNRRSRDRRQPPAPTTLISPHRSPGGPSCPV